MKLTKKITKFGSITLALTSLAACLQPNVSTPSVYDLQPHHSSNAITPITEPPNKPNVSTNEISLTAAKKKTLIKPYPLKICLVSDEPLDEWDDMKTMVYKGQEMKFCCDMCLKKFKKEPQKYLKLLEDT